ncbi:hypothetical protein Aduo_019087 [Ancylostoma duodenale]
MNINIASHKIYNYIGIIVELREQGKSVSFVLREIQKLSFSFAFTYDMLWRFLKRFESSEVRKKAFVLRLHSVDCSTRFCFAKKRNPFSRMRSRAKHPGKGPIWGGISSRGATQLAILPGSCRINSEVYCRILEKCYKPFAGSAHNGFAWIVQDNAPCHKSHYTTEKLLEWGIESLDWPAESPDLNPMSLSGEI